MCEITGDMEVSWYTKIACLNNNPLDSIICVLNVVQMSDVAHGPRFGFFFLRWKLVNDYNIENDGSFETFKISS